MMHQANRSGFFDSGFLLFLLLSLAALPAVAGTNRWTSNGPYGGPITKIVIDPTAPDTLYAATGGSAQWHSYGCGILKSTDGGANWTPINQGITVHAIRCLVLDTRAPTTLYAGCADQDRSHQDVVKTTDGGATWVQAPPTEARDITIDPLNSDIVYAAGGWVKKSTDGGATWNRVGVGLEYAEAQVIVIDPSETSTIYAGSQFFGVKKSLDGGQNFAPASSGMGDVLVLSMALDPVSPQTLYAGVSLHLAGGHGGLFKSTDGAATWRRLEGGLPDRAVSCITIDPRDPATLYACALDTWRGLGRGLFKSTDGGESWVDLSEGLPTLQVCSLTVHPRDSSTLYAATMTGVYKSLDGGATWRDANHGMTNQRTHMVAIDPEEPAKRYAATLGGVFKSEDGGKTWEVKNRGLGGLAVTHILLDPFDHRTLFAATLNHAQWPVGDLTPNLFKSADEGETWVSAAPDYRASMYNAFVADPLAPGHFLACYMAGSFGGLDETTDWGALWVDRSANALFSFIVSLAFDPFHSGVAYAGAHRGFAKSFDGGATWELMGGEIIQFQVYCILMDPVRPDTLYVGGFRTDFGEGGVFVSHDGGVTFEVYGYGHNVVPSTMVLDPTPPWRFYLGLGYEGGGVYVSSDEAGYWDSMNRGLSNEWVAHLVSDPATPRTLCASIGGYLFPLRCAVLYPQENGWGSGVYTYSEEDVPPPVITRVSKASGPFRLILKGSNFHREARIYIDGVLVPQTAFVRATQILAKGGAALKAMVPKGKTVQITVENDDDGDLSGPFPYTR